MIDIYPKTDKANTAINTMSICTCNVFCKVLSHHNDYNCSESKSIYYNSGLIKGQIISEPH